MLCSWMYFAGDHWTFIHLYHMYVCMCLCMSTCDSLFHIVISSIYSKSSFSNIQYGKLE